MVIVHYGWVGSRDTLLMLCDGHNHFNLIYLLIFHYGLII